MPASSSRSRARLRRIIVAAVLVALAILSGAAGVFGYAAMSIDALEAKKERALIERAIERNLARMEENVTSATIWSDAYLKTAQDFDQEWAQVNFGDYYADYMNQEVSLAYDNAGRLVYASRDSEPVTVQSEAVLARAVAPLVRQVRAEAAGKRFNANGERIVGFAAAATREAIVSADGNLYMVAISTVVPEDLPSARYRTPDPVVVSARAMPAFLETIRDDLIIDAPRLVPVAVGESPAGVPLRGPNGKMLGQIVWNPDRPGMELLQRGQGLGWVLLAVIGIAAAMLLIRVQHMLRELDANERALDQTLLDLTAARDLAESGNHAKSQFLATMSHELRTPLNGVIALADLLAPLQQTEEAREMAGLISTSGRTLEYLVNDILDVARIEDGRMILEDEVFDLGACLGRVADLHAATAAAKGLQIDRRIEASAQGLHRGDSTRVTQIVSNLLNNAIKFTEAGRVSLIARRRGGFLKLIVADTGLGFDRETAGRLFQRFEQADKSITRRFGGSGLGLSICDGLARAMGGSVRARSAPGKGSVFIATLTLPREAGAAPAEAAPTARPAALEAGAKTPRVLLAEDHPANQRVVALILAGLGVDLTIVDNGQAAVEAASFGGFDLVLMDMQMPVMDGLTATRRIREHEAATGAARTPIVSLTANAMAEHIAASAAAGCDRHLAKPIRPDALIDCVLGLAQASDPGPSVAAA